jgi:biopolymer transport protein ExbB/TolQ
VNLETLQVTALILSIVLYLALITLIVMAIPAFRELRKWLKGSEELRSLVRTLTPTVTNAAENISYLSAAFRSDADELGQTVRRATTSANEIIDSARDRAAEINGFLEVVQEEAESTFLNTASLAVPR